MKRTLMTMALSAALASTALGTALAEIRIAHVYGKTGALEAYAEQSHIGLMMGLEYATDGTMQVNGEDIVIIEKDTQLRPEIARAMLAEAYGDDDVVLALGGVSSAAALAMLPIAQDYEKVFLVEPAVADSITGSDWNRYIFRTGRNSSQDAISNAVALAGEDVHIATLAQDYAFGRDGVAAFKDALDGTGTEIVHEEYVPTDTTDFTAAAARMFEALQEIEGRKIVFVIWAGGGNPLGALSALEPERFDIEVATGGNILSALGAYKDFPGMEGATYYYHDIPDNEINDWLVEQHMERYDSPPDFFTAGGMAAGLAIVKALETAESYETEDLIAAMEGMEWETPKGTMIFRPEDHQALQAMYHFKIRVEEDVPWAIPELVRVLEIEDMDIPINNAN